MSTSRYAFARYLVGACAARVASEGVAIALVIVARATGESAPVAGFLVAAWSGPSLVSGLVVGHRLDRSARPRRVLLIAGVVAAAALGLDATAIGRVPAAALIAVTAVGGATVPLFTGGLSALVAELVGAEDLGRAQALDSAAYSVSGIAGPALVALLATSWSPRGALAVPALAVLGGVVALPAVRRRHGDGDGDGDAVASRSVPISRRLRALTHTRALGAATVATTLAALGWGGLEIAAVAVAALIASPHVAGLYLTVLAAAALVGALAVARRPLRNPDRCIAACLLVITAGAALVALAGSALVAAVGFAVFGVGDGVLLPATLAVRARDAPAGLSASVFTTAASLKTAAGALGAGVAGLLVAWLGARGLFWAIAGSQLVAAACTIPAWDVD